MTVSRRGFLKIGVGAALASFGGMTLFARDEAEAAVVSGKVTLHEIKLLPQVLRNFSNISVVGMAPTDDERDINLALNATNNSTGRTVGLVTNHDDNTLIQVQAKIDGEPAEVTRLGGINGNSDVVYAAWDNTGANVLGVAQTDYTGERPRVGRFWPMQINNTGTPFYPESMNNCYDVVYNLDNFNAGVHVRCGGLPITNDTCVKRLVTVEGSHYTSIQSVADRPHDRVWAVCFGNCAIKDGKFWYQQTLSPTGCETRTYSFPDEFSNARLEGASPNGKVLVFSYDGGGLIKSGANYYPMLATPKTVNNRGIGIAENFTGKAVRFQLNLG